MLKSYEYRIYPTDDQIVKLLDILGQVRFVYSLGFEAKINDWKTHRKSVSAFDLNNQIRDLKDHTDRIDTPSQINDILNIKNFASRIKLSVTQRESLDYACDVETKKFLAFV